MTISHEQAVEQCRRRSLARRKREALGRAGKLSLPAPGSPADDRRWAAFRAYWRSCILRVDAHNHRVKRLDELGLDPEAGAPIFWPEYWRDYPTFENHTLSTYHRGQRIATARGPGSTLHWQNFRWFWGQGAPSAADGQLGTQEFL